MRIYRNKYEIAVLLILIVPLLFFYFHPGFAWDGARVITYNVNVFDKDSQQKINVAKVNIDIDLPVKTVCTDADGNVSIIAEFPMGGVSNLFRGALSYSEPEIVLHVDKEGYQCVEFVRTRQPERGFWNTVFSKDSFDTSRDINIELQKTLSTTSSPKRTDRGSSSD